MSIVTPVRSEWPSKSPRVLVTRHFTGVGDDPKPWLFPRLVQLAKQWLDECVTFGDDAFCGQLLISAGSTAAEKPFGALLRQVGLCCTSAPTATRMNRWVTAAQVGRPETALDQMQQGDVARPTRPPVTPEAATGKSSG